MTKDRTRVSQAKINGIQRRLRSQILAGIQEGWSQQRKRGYTYAQVAKAMGMTESIIPQIIRGETQVRFEVLCELVLAMGLDMTIHVH